MAFSTGMTQKTFNTRLFRKVSFENFLKEGELCFSTEENSSSLYWRGQFCLVLESNTYTGSWYDGDADAGRNMGYDEFRVSFTKEELLASIAYIVVPNEWVDSEMDINSDDYNQDNDPYEWIENLSQYGIVIPEREYKGEMNFNFTL